MRVYLLSALLLAVAAAVQLAQCALSTTEKQLMLDIHNFARAQRMARGMREMRWDVDLAEKAQEYAEGCNFRRNPNTRRINGARTGEVLYFNTTEVDSIVLSAIEDFNTFPESYLNQILWSNSSLVGCGSQDCPRLIMPGTRISAIFLVCYYDPAYIAGLPIYTPAEQRPCTRDACPPFAPFCVDFRRGGEGFEEYFEYDDGDISQLCSDDGELPPRVPEDEDPSDDITITRRVTSIRPLFGSWAGGTELTIEGEGFSGNLFEGANEVFLTGDGFAVPCDVVNFHSNSKQIVCFTRANPIEADLTLNDILVLVTLEDGSRVEVEGCSWCSFRYQQYWFTPSLQTILPLASSPRELITFSGSLYGNEFTDDPEDADDFFIRILVGGRGCEPVDEDGVAYPSFISEDGVFARVTCRPTVPDVIESLNVSLILGRRGMAQIYISELLYSLDNRLRPYTFQTHADVQSVSPREGSAEGGTRVTITLDMAVTGYTTDIQVRVGGVPCYDIEAIDDFTIQCTTGASPPDSTYYPGGRGLLREVWMRPDFTDLDLDDVESRPRSVNTSVQERTSSRYDREGSEFGESELFSHRFSGFFVPPVSSNYSFNIRSDDLSRFYLSPNTSYEHRQLIAYANRHTSNRWDLLPSQLSEPLYLEAGRYYYMEYVANQYPGPWYMSVGVKVHSLNFTGYPYDGDMEQQVVSISSTVIQERHEITLAAVPMVLEITILALELSDPEEAASCQIDLVISLEKPSSESYQISISPDTQPEELEEVLNSVPLIREIGRVEVKRNDEADVGLIFVVVFLTRFGVTDEQIPRITPFNSTSEVVCASSNASDAINILEVFVRRVQNLTYTTSFTVGFDAEGTTQRFTSALSPGISADELESNISQLFEQECQRSIDPAVGLETNALLYYESYERSGHSRRDFSSSFCERYSEFNPGFIWADNNGVPAVDFRYFCFGYRGNLPRLRVRVQYYGPTDDDPPRFQLASDQVNIDMRNCRDWPVGDSRTDFWYPYVCLDMLNCITDQLENTFQLPNTQNHFITRVYFNYVNDFWIDEIAISRVMIELTQAAPRVRPGGILIDAVEVTGGRFPDGPSLFNFTRSNNEQHSPSNTSDPGDNGNTSEPSNTSEPGTTSDPGNDTDISGDGTGSGSGSGSMSSGSDIDYVMLYASFEVTYEVSNCIAGIPTLSGYYEVEGFEEPPRVDIQRVETASGPVEGSFDLRFGDDVIPGIPADADADTFELFLEYSLPEEGGFEVSRGGSCAGYSWSIAWETKGGDLPEFEVEDDSSLNGTDVEVEIGTTLDGGTWLRPIRGDMLRLPHDEPQVEVIINGIPSSCSQDVCSFNFSSDTTPVVDFVFPYEGQSGSTITIYGSSFGDSPSDITVTIGNADCEIFEANDTHIFCVAGDHPAGFYQVTVRIGDVGFARYENDSCFYYLLFVDSISPSVGGAGGGQILTITGGGFMDFENFAVDEFGAPLDSFPWFRFGLGLPTFEQLQNLNLCPLLESQLEELNLGLLASYDVQSVLQLIAAGNRNNSNFTNSSNFTDSLNFTADPFNNEAGGEFNDTDSGEPRDDFADRDHDNFESEFYFQVRRVLGSFPMSVEIGGIPCAIIRANLTQIECVSIFSLPNGAVNVTVYSLLDSATLENAFEFTANDSVLITSIEPTIGNVVGNSTVSIYGSNFLGDEIQGDFEFSVSIGESQCSIEFANDTLIICVAMPTRPSHEPVFVSTPNGIGVLESALMQQVSDSNSSDEFDSQILAFPIFWIQLEVSEIAPQRGSIFGGTIVRIYGGIFVDGYTTVSFGGQPAEILSVTPDVIECITPSLNGRHYTNFEVGNLQADRLPVFSWSQRELYIRVGDTVVWNWDLSRLGLDLEVYQVASNFSTTQLQDGFHSDRATADSFEVRFEEIGEYYFIGELDQFTVFSGVIYVFEPHSSNVEFEVFVNGHRAEFNPVTDDDGSTSTADFFFFKRERRDSSGISSGFDPDSFEPESVICQDRPELLYYEQFDIGFYNSRRIPLFIFSVCSTPVVYFVSPQTSRDLIPLFTISGVGFQFSEELNTIYFGDYPCTVYSSCDTEISCVFERVDSPSFIELPLSLHISGLGNAFITTPDNAHVTLYPVVTFVEPSAGSLQGGTEIEIYGTGFLDYEVSGTELSEYETSVRIGEYDCSVLYATYDLIRCVTSAASEAGEYNISVVQREVEFACSPPEQCIYTYSQELTPQVLAIEPVEVMGTIPTLITLSGSAFSEIAENNLVAFGGYSCQVVEANSSFISCFLDRLPAGVYDLALSVCNTTIFGTIQCLGDPYIAQEASFIFSTANFTSVSPSSGSILGGTILTIVGAGFHYDASFVQVSIDGSVCTVLQSDYTTVVCRTSLHSEGTLNIAVLSNNVQFPIGVQFSYSTSSTPVITGVTPQNGQVGDIVTVEGTGLSTTAEDNMVFVENEPCVVTSVSEDGTSLDCVLPQNFAGNHPIAADISGMGSAMSDISIDYNLVLNSVFPNNGSFGGLNSIFISGASFHPNSITITIGGMPCELSSEPQFLNQIECIAPSICGTVADEAFDVIIETLDQIAVIPNGYVFLAELTPFLSAINRTRGGTQGGSRILLTGQGFTGPATVTIGGIECEVLEQSDTTIVCETGSSGATRREQVIVLIEDRGFACSEDIYFWYVDVWSSRFTWGGESPPIEGDFVVVDAGQTLLLDVVTPVLSYFLIRGGELIFDDEQGDDMVGLHTFGMLIIDGGRLQIGTEAEPFLAKTEVVLYGNVLSTEIPVYGAKTLALRSGSIDMHGRPLDITWTKLSQTADMSATELHLQDTVDWEIGGKIVVASTSFSQRENEELTITDITQGDPGSILTVSPPLSYKHISVQQTFNGKFIDTSAEVGYLTRNIVVRGNVNEDFVQEVEACEEDFRPGQFEVQSCFLGRFGAESLTDQFGSQIMVHAAEQNLNDVAGRFEYIEVTHAGQAFRLGRYPIHFHLNGNVSGSYIRGCAFHHTFNRAVTLHGVDNFLVEKNVAYNVLGHAFFLEDGNEQHNIIQDNLGVFVRASSSLLNVDITPATFWIVNPNNIVRRNAAAGGTHFGFWYRLPEHPTGPSFTRDICPRHLPVEEFANNTAHSFGWYGLWVFRHYTPRAGGGCNDQEHTTAVFENFLSWRNDRGVEFAEVGTLQLVDSCMMDNRLAGVEVTELEDSLWGENGPLIRDTIIVGYSDISDDEDFCTESGIKTPHSYYLTVSGVTFINFDRTGCFPIQACSHCKPFQGGFETRYERINFVNAGSDLTRWQWTHEHIHRDLDGSLTQTGVPSLLIPSNGLLSPESCMHHAPSSFGLTVNGTNGSICDGSLEFARTGIFNPFPSSLQFTNIEFSNDYGSTIVPFRPKRLLGTGPGLMASLAVNQSFDLVWIEGTTFTNISYTQRISGLAPENYFVFNQPFLRELDTVNIAGEEFPSNASLLEDANLAQTGNWHLDNALNSTVLSYFIRGITSDPPDTFDVTFQTEECFYEDCIVPPPPTLPPLIPAGRPNETQNWFDPLIWPNNTIPQEGDDVFINCSLYIILNGSIPRLGTLTICGGLELDIEFDHVIEVDFIIIQGGRLTIGYPDTPLPRTRTACIILHGNALSPEFGQLGGLSIGSKAIAVFGELMLHGAIPEVVWTYLSTTATAGSNTITLIGEVDWEIGDSIVITSTSYEAEETEKFQILEMQGSTIVLNGTLQYTHTAEDFSAGSKFYSIRAEVGLLSRNIVIKNGEDDLAIEESFGCRVLVGTFRDELFQTSVGLAQISGVEFDGCGQLGYIDSFDPRYALAFAGLGNTESYVRYSSIHDGYNVGIGVFGTNGMTMEYNVIHSTVGESMIVDGFDHIVNFNLASYAQFLGTYRDRNEEFNSDWTANFELVGASDIEFIGNVAAGGAKSGIHTNGEECEGRDTSVIRSNIVHSTLHGVHIGYNDGFRSGCLRLAEFLVYSCYHYSIFSYSGSGVLIQDVELVDNKAAIYVSVIGPASLSHMLGEKSVLVENSLIVSASGQLTCEQEDSRPLISTHLISHAGLPPPNGGKVGIVMPSFVSGRGHFPLASWASIISYPAINGITMISGVCFANFATRCDGRDDVVLMTNRNSEDCNHPIHLEEITFATDTPQSLKLFNHRPNLGSVNPSDCVDMDCDGLKHVLLKDLDGSFTEAETPSLHTMISMAEFEWDEDPRRGIGDYRIPRTMLATADGMAIDANDLYPSKGVIRESLSGETRCDFVPEWNMYACSEIDHLMLVLESLDEDTEVRRLSPIGLGTTNTIDLLNGPMDNGWCGGYTCQERISTFYGLVASGFSYIIGLTSTNPQNFGLHLINADDTQSITVAIIYTNPQRLDIYVDDSYVPPENAFYDEDDNLQYMDGPIEDFIPTPESAVDGANVYDRDLKRLYITLRGNRDYRIVTSQVIQLSLTLSVSVDDFFDSATIVRNIALLLGIDTSRIRLVNVVRETARRKRQTDNSTEAVELNIEIGDPPSQTLSPPASNTSDTGSMNQTANTTSSQNDTSSLSFEELVEIGNMFVEAVQTGELQEALNDTEVVSVAVEEPQPPVTDPTNGTRATPDTGGPQPEDISQNDTILTFFEQQQIQEEIEQNETDVIVFSIPSELVILTQAVRAREGVPISQDQSAPRIAMHDNNGIIVENLGLEIPWVLTAMIGTGPEGAFLTEADVNMTGGVGDFSELIFSHPGTYTLDFTVTYPPTAQFSVASSVVTIAPRELELQILTQPSDGNTTFALYPYPAVQLTDRANSEIVLESWRNATWIATASIARAGSSTSEETYTAQLVNGVAEFTDVVVSNPGTYEISFFITTATGDDIDVVVEPVSSTRFTIRENLFTLLRVTYPVNYAEVIGPNEEYLQSFIERFVETIRSSYPEVEVYEITVEEGSIIVSFYATTSDPNALINFVNDLTTTPSTSSALSFTFNNVQLNPSNVTRDPNFPIALEDDDQLILILATAIPAGTVLLAAILLVVCVCCCQVYKKKSKFHKISVKPASTEVEVNEDRYVQYRNAAFDSENMPEYTVHMNGQSAHSSADSTPQLDRRELVVSSKEVHVTPKGHTFANPHAQKHEAEGNGKLSDLENSIDEIWNRGKGNVNNNNNNSNNNNRGSASSDDSVGASAFYMNPHVVLSPAEEEEAMMGRVSAMSNASLIRSGTPPQTTHSASVLQHSGGKRLPIS